ncbi:MAG: TonB-dependent receptor [Bryobacteraceae bacterium]|nr:TonB-dependent receptor [Bryobacteraceae bacterium]
MHSRPGFTCFVSLATAICLLPFLASAQSEFGSIVGTVVDSSEAPIAGATITFQNTETNQTFTAVTSSDGAYTSPPLRPGNYTMAIGVQGFKSLRRTLQLDVNQRALVNMQLEVGSVSESVTVVSDAQLLETQTAALGNVRTTKAINDLPLNGRNFVQLFHIATGVTPVGSGPTLSPTASNQGGVMGGAVNGARPSQNDFRYDGIQSQDTDQNILLFIPNPDAIQEFKVQTSAMDASFGRSGGATVNLVTKSGSNEYHGSLFEFFRNSALDAKNYFDSPTDPIPPFRQNQFGGTFGGRLLRDRTFFFGAFQGTRNRQAQTYLSTVPLDAYKRGDFRSLPLRLYDPLTTVTSGSSTTRQPFVDNQIPFSRFDPAGRKLIELYPSPNLPGVVNNYLFNPTRESDTNQFDARIDHRFSEKDSFFTRYSNSRMDAYNPSFLPGPALGNGPSYPGINAQRAHQVALSYNRTFSPTLIYEFRAGFSRLRLTNDTKLAGSNLSDQIGIPGVNLEPRLSGLGAISVSGFRGLGQSEFNPLLKVNNNFQYTNRFTKIAGAHTWKMGHELLRRQFNQFSPVAPMGTYSFNGQFTQNPASASGTGSAIADLVLGLQNSSRLDIEAVYGQRRWEHSLFVNDDIRMTRRLTVNLGLRYELVTPFTEVADRQGGLVPGLGFVYRVNTPEFPGRTVNATDYTNLAPRVGIAFQVTPKTVVRTGYGIFYTFPGIASGRLASKSPPTAGNIAINNNTFATNLATVTPVSAGFPTTRPSTFDPTNSNFKYSPYNDADAYVQQWNFNIQRELPANFVLTTAYVGSRGIHLYIFPNINQPVPGPGAINPRRLYPNLANADGVHKAGDSWYHSLQLTAEKRYSQGLTFLAGYTYGKALDTAGGDNGGGPQNPWDIRAERGPADFDIRQRLVMSWTYELPFGRGRSFGNGTSGWQDQIIGGWNINGIQSFMTGFRFTPSSAQNTLGSGAGGQRPDRIGAGNLPTDQRTILRWFDTSAFTTPRLYTFGNAGRGILEGPGTKVVDLSVFKRFRIGKSEVRQLEYRAEFFNIANTPQFNVPNASVGSPAAGRIDSAGEKTFFQRTSRQIQMALKLYF